MPLTPGTRLGPYEVSAQIGEGGMGEVYRATDTNLRRDVAIKVLPEAVAADPERLARFQREAQVLAALNHPNIAQIYGVEKSDGTIALVMELVDGPTPADQIARGPLASSDALAIARQIAEALEAAHEQGIVRRDLKPANVKVRPDGTVKLLDFGLAKAITQDPGPGTRHLSQSPTITTPAMTQMGMIPGTAACMSPEPARVRKVLRICLQKDPRQRGGDIAAIRLALDGAFETGSASPGAPAPAPVSGWRRATPLGAAVLLTALVVGGLAWFLRPVQAPVGTTRFAVPRDGRPALGGGQAIAISPHGRLVAYVAQQGLFLRSMDELEPRLLSPRRTARA